MSAPIRFEDVHVRSASGTVLSLEVPAHCAVSLVGDFRSGVEHLAAMVLGLTQPERGRVLVLGEDVARLSRSAVLAFRRRLGYVPAGDGLLQNLTLADNIALPLRFGTGMTQHDIDTRVRLLLALVRLTDAAGRRPADADEEQRRRSSLARALATDPDLVVLEQPFDGLSGRAASELLELARGGETAEGSRRTLFITGQELPDRLRPRIEVRHRVVHGQLQPDQ